MCLQAMKTAANKTAVSKEINKIAQTQKNQQRTAISSKLASHDNRPLAQMQSFDLTQSHLIKSHESTNYDWFVKRTTRSSAKSTNYVSLSTVMCCNLFLSNSILFPLLACFLHIFALVRNYFYTLKLCMHCTTWHLVAITSCKSILHSLFFISTFLWSWVQFSLFLP